MRGWDMKMGSTEFKKWVPRRDLAPQWARLTLAHSSRIALLTRGVEEPAQAVRHPQPGRRRGDPRPGHGHPGGDRNRLPSRAGPGGLRKSTRLNSSHEWISYAVF